MNRYLVTGGLGVIGSLFAKSRDRAGDCVAVLDDGPDERHALNGSGLSIGMRHRLGAAGAPAITPQAYDRIFHAAASTGIPYSGQEPLDEGTGAARHLVVDPSLGLLPEVVEVGGGPLVRIAELVARLRHALEVVDQRLHGHLVGR